LPGANRNARSSQRCAAERSPAAVAFLPSDKASNAPLVE
jgi:hypothetical protein